MCASVFLEFLVFSLICELCGWLTRAAHSEFLLKAMLTQLRGGGRPCWPGLVGGQELL